MSVLPAAAGSTVNIAVAAGFTAMAGSVFYLAGAGRMTGGPDFQVAIGRALSHLFRRIEIWTAPVPEPVLGLALLALVAMFVAALHGRHPDPDPDSGQDQRLDPSPGADPGAAGQPPVPAGDETDPAHAPPDHRTAAGHHCHPPVRSHP